VPEVDADISRTPSISFTANSTKLTMADAKPTAVMGSIVGRGDNEPRPGYCGLMLGTPREEELKKWHCRRHSSAECFPAAGASVAMAREVALVSPILGRWPHESALDLH